MIWTSLDTWTVITAALAGMACAVPGTFLVLRRQSMLGDALSHTVLLGVVGGYLLAKGLVQLEWIDAAGYEAVLPVFLLMGAVLIGLLTAGITEWIHRRGGVETSASLGVVFTTLFAIGLLLLQAQARLVHIDPQHVLFGQVETAVLQKLPGTGVPQAAFWSGLIFLMNVGLTALVYKELRLAAFDPQAAESMGLNVRLIHYGLMVVTSVTLIGVFDAVGCILAIAMLTAPAVTARFLTHRLGWLLVYAVVIAAVSGAIAHASVLWIIPTIFSGLGYPTVQDASTAGMTCVVAGLLFLAAFFFGPEGGLWRKS
ncbi:metal ABC transporter permease [Calycomorphotria hydatis]|uniref:Manganese transport system membrane protein MntB n=1 Tax=Calycomorphotria hydatis TaxID=2528027 RepID=A0A517T519_9PLAN|nr:metal ABC transporter permease [Calycomorphotria hydatis]QDT63476.1 Manganese transport system membrane protein MntB [Calycomorphotria hydatis]